MGRQRTIQYAVDGAGLVISRVDDQIAAPLLDYEGMKPENGFEMQYKLEEFPVFALTYMWGLVWTRKIPTEIKNLHRAFWGMKPLKAAVA
jgi:hypothetical protein